MASNHLGPVHIRHEAVVIADSQDPLLECGGIRHREGDPDVSGRVPLVHELGQASFRRGGRHEFIEFDGVEKDAETGPATAIHTARRTPSGEEDLAGAVCVGRQAEGVAVVVGGQILAAESVAADR
ncbi:MAG: hypothetical protein FJ387_23400 [Verrucomicrobia bacterium]|nr:hypothetical protein [Verrucomicrobiota bacterium]